jgi:mannose-6-phosphate isomerase
MKPYPLEFNAILKLPIWGTEKWIISAVEGNESIVINGENKGLSLKKIVDDFGPDLLGKYVHEKWHGKFPLLVKFIDAKKDLSIQVHPNDAIALKRHNCLGKNEMWYVLGTGKGAKLISGFKKEITSDEYVNLVAKNKLVDVLNICSVQQGDIYYIPAGRVHSICGGCFLLEIQESSDITYRIYDYGRLGTDGKPRQLHTEFAKDAIDYKVVEKPEGKFIGNGFKDNSNALVHSNEFCVDKIDIESEYILNLEDCFSIIVCTEGEMKIVYNTKSSVKLAKFESVLIPAKLGSVLLKGKGEFVRAWVSPSCRDL